MVNTKGKVRVFVYGTLKREHPNNIVLTSTKATRVGFDKVVGPYDMVSLGGFPAIVYAKPDENGKLPTNVIYGEVWAGDQDMLRATDMLEGYPSFYNRTKIHTQVNNLKCWMYFIEQSNYLNDRDLVKNNCWVPTEDERMHWELPNG